MNDAEIHIIFIAHPAKKHIWPIFPNKLESKPSLAGRESVNSSLVAYEMMLKYVTYLTDTGKKAVN